MGKSFQSIATKFPHPGLHIAVNPKAEPKEGTIKISPNKTLQSLSILRCRIAKDTLPVTAAILFPCVELSHHSFCHLRPQIAKARRGGRGGKVTAVITLTDNIVK